MSTTNETRPATQIPALNPLRWKALAVLAMVQFIIFVDATIVNVALPTIRTDLGLDADGLAWVVNSYLIAAGGLLLFASRLGDRLGRRRVFCWGSALFAVASITAGLAVNSTMLLTGRVLQGVAEALAAPAGLAMVAVLFTDPSERAKAFGIWAGLSGLGSAAGVLLSGVFTDLLTWRLIFLINVPLAIIPLLVLPRLVPETKDTTGARRLDWLGATLITGGLFAVIFGLLSAVNYPWESGRVAGSLLGGLLVLAVALVVEARTPQPLLPLAFFRNRIRLTANAVTVIIGGVSAAVFFMVVLYAQDVLGYPPLQSGLAWLPFVIGFMVGLMVSMQLMLRFGTRTAMAAGLAVAAVGLYWLHLLPVDGSFVTDLLPATVVVAIGFGMTNPAMQQTSLHDVSEEEAALGSGVLMTLLQLSGALGLAVYLTVALQHRDGQIADGVTAAAASVSGFSLAFLIGAIVLALGSASVLFLLRGMPKPTRTADGKGAPQVQGAPST